MQVARAQVRPAKQEFILDVQGHFIDTPKRNSKNTEVFLKDVFMDSDTDVMVLSFVPSPVTPSRSRSRPPSKSAGWSTS